MKRIITFSIICLFLGCSKKETVLKPNSSQIVFNDVLDREVSLAKPAERVFLGFYFETFLSIEGSFDKVKVMSKGEWRDFFYSQWTRYEEDMPELKNIEDSGSIYGGKFSMERLISSNPDVAIVAPWQYEMLGENVNVLEKSGIPVVVVDYNSMTLERHKRSTEIIGIVMGREERANKMANEYVNHVNDVIRRVKKFENNKKRVYFELANKSPKVYGNSYGDYMWGGLVKQAGGNNIALGKVESYGSLNPEFILHSNPQVIFFSGLSFRNKDKEYIPMGFDIDDNVTQSVIDKYPNRPGWEKIDAIVNKEVYCVDHAGLRTLYDFVYLQYIAKSLYPEAFEDVDPKENQRKFYLEYLSRVKFNGNFMTKWNGRDE